MSIREGAAEASEALELALKDAERELDDEGLDEEIELEVEELEVAALALTLDLEDEELELTPALGFSRALGGGRA